MCVTNSGYLAAVRSWDSIGAFLEFWLENDLLVGPERSVFNRYYGGYLKKFGSYIQRQYTEQSREAVQLIRTSERLDILEVGAGCGTESLWYGLLGADVTAIDLNLERLNVARVRRDWLKDNVAPAIKVEYVEASLFEYDVSSGYDLVWMEQTFHHLEPRQNVYGKLMELVRPGGHLIISETNAWNLLVQLQLFMRRGLKTKTFFIDEAGRRIEYGNERITTPFALCRALRRSGFEVKSVRHFRMLPNLATVPSVVSGFETSLLKVFPWLSTHYNVVARKPG